MNTPNLKFKVSDETKTVGTPTDGISFIMGKALRGRINKPEIIFSSWPQFEKEHGGIADDNTGILVRRLLEKGGLLRFCRLAHYTDIDDPETLTATKPEPDDEIWDTDSNELFKLNMKDPGAYDNNVQVVITAGLNGLPGYFNISITHPTNPTLSEFYPNLVIKGKPNIIDSNYLRVITESSKLVDVEYRDLSVLTTVTLPLVPVPATITYEDGTDGGSIVSTDIIGSSITKSGFHAFDDYDDSYQIMLASNHNFDLTPVHVAGNAYAAMRDDLQYWAHIPNTMTDAETIIDFKTGTGISSKHTAFFMGGLNVTHPITGAKTSIEAITDIAALAANSDSNFGPYYSFAGNQRGLINGALSVVNNFGLPAKFAQLNLLANRGINSIINRDNQIKLWGQFTSLLGVKSQEQFIQVVRGTFFIKKSLRPILENFIEEPNDIPSWKMLHYQVKPFLEKLVDGRALYSYRWEGDQDASSLDNLTVNTKTDVGLGKYKVKLFLSFIPGMQEIEVNLILQNGGVTIE